jgi:hypothetical protein
MEFPSNSHRVTEPPKEKPEAKKVEPVVVNNVERRKTSFGRRFADTFVGGDARNVVQYVLFEVLVPAAKATITDAVSQGVERMIFGEGTGGSRRTGGYRSGGPSSYVSYNKFSSKRDPREEPRGMSRQARANHDFGEIILATRAEAELVIERLFHLVNEYEVATVADLLELVGETPSYMDGKWGWDDMHGASVRRYRNEGYLLELPRTKPVD